MKNWNIIPSDINFQFLLSKELGIQPITAQVLLNRGIDTTHKAEKFLRSHITDLSNPHRLPDIDRSINRLKQAINNKEKILIFGDYDVDGISSSVLLGSLLVNKGVDFECFLPHRIKDGYGLNKDIIERLRNLSAHGFAVRRADRQDKKTSLLICVDCGTSNREEIKALKNIKIDTIVIDHHECARDTHPPALGFINPKRKDSDYPYRDLASVGIVFRFLQAFTEKDLLEDLDLVSLGTVADVVPLHGENRILVKQGLKQIKETKRLGLAALIESCGLKGRDISCSNIGFILGPRLNATGRVDSARKSLNLLMSKDAKEVKLLCQELNHYNSLRQRIGDEILREAQDMVERDINFKEHYAIVLAKEGWHQGVLGIVASRITERFYRPCIVISLYEELGKGSGRSIKDFHLYDALSQCADSLEAFGGHKLAAGLVVQRDNIDKFKTAINEAAKKMLKAEHLVPSLDIDAVVALSDIDEDLVCELESLEPFGIGNSHPLFCSKNLEVREGVSILKGDTLRFWVTDGVVTYCAVGYRMKEYLPLVKVGSKVDLVYTPRLDNWQGEQTITLEVKDIKCTHSQ